MIRTPLVSNSLPLTRNIYFLINRLTNSHRLVQNLWNFNKLQKKTQITHGLRRVNGFKMCNLVIAPPPNI